MLGFILYLRVTSKCKPPGGYIRRGDFTEGLLRYEFGGGFYMEDLVFGILGYNV